MSSLLDTSFKESDYKDLQKGQISEVFDAGIWQEMEPRARKIASYVSLQLLFQDGRKLKTEGNLWCYKTTYLTKVNEKTKEEEPYEKLELYIQKIANTNRMVAFEVRMPLRQDLTRFCSRLPRSQIRESRFSPFLIFIVGYSFWVNILQYLPTLGFYIDITDPFLLTINVAALTSICWFGYMEYKLEGYWATLFEFDRSRLNIGLDIQSTVAGRITHTVRVRRSLTIYRAQIFYSEVMHTEALKYNKEELAKLIKGEEKKKISDQESQLNTKKAEIKQLTTELDQAHTALEGSEKRIRKAIRTGFRMRGDFEGEPLFQSENVFANLMDSGLLKMALIGGAVIIALWIIAPYLMDFEFGGLPEVSLMWQMIIFGTLIFVTILIMAVVIIKAWKAT